MNTEANAELVGRSFDSMKLAISTGGEFSSPEDFMGHWTVLYFYPKDDTPGCTVQACSYRDSLEEFKKLNAQVIGVSSDDLDSHSAFISKFDLNFPLIADVDNTLRTFLSVNSRDTFLINPEGVIAKVWRGVSPKTTVQETLEAIN